MSLIDNEKYNEAVRESFIEDYSDAIEKEDEQSAEAIWKNVDRIKDVGLRNAVTEDLADVWSTHCQKTKV